jgi:NAD(P)-dependent dehydrogenase (short-subunit alcohol dehydrogenase family)
VVQAPSSSHGCLLLLKLDVTDPTQVPAAGENAQARFGSVDVDINNTCIDYFAAIEEGEARWRGCAG